MKIFQMEKDEKREEAIAKLAQELEKRRVEKKLPIKPIFNGIIFEMMLDCMEDMKKNEKTAL